MKTKEFQELNRLLTSMPTNLLVEIGTEETDDGETVLCACLFVKPPEDGWKTEGDRFGYRPGSPRSLSPCPERYKYENRVVFGVNGDGMWNALYDGLKDFLATYQLRGS